ncbi:hypothetical protein [Tellurirhabdus bombi]|uniref:hypothetical protein n=1 Tax=Tellurirhabdus bombi TaxID=2907205 RepID=UPI001F1B2305|nr:hypothetical protein [Tellurirhabdus bombi]
MDFSTINWPVVAPIISAISVVLFNYIFNRSLNTTIENVKADLGRDNIFYTKYIERKLEKLEKLYESTFQYYSYIRDNYNLKPNFPSYKEGYAYRGSLNNNLLKYTNFNEVNHRVHAAAFYLSEDSRKLLREFVIKAYSIETQMFHHASGVIEKAHCDPDDFEERNELENQYRGSDANKSTELQTLLGHLNNIRDQLIKDIITKDPKTKNPASKANGVFKLFNL